jgi:hypothetical protein
MAGGGLLVIMLFFGLAGGMVARMKGGSFAMWFTVSFAIPFLGLLTAVLYRHENTELRRECPGCGRVLKLYDAVCMNCGEELDFPEVAISATAGGRRRAA